MSSIIRKIVFGGIAVFGALGVASNAAASPFYQVGTDPEQTLPTSAVGPFTFTSTSAVQLTRSTIIGPISINCNDVNLVGELSLVPGTPDLVRIEVIDGWIGDTSSLCSGVSLNFSTPWRAEVDVNDLPTSYGSTTPIAGVFQNLSISTPPFGQNCGGSTINASFNNNGGPGVSQSSFNFNDSVGSCSINGALFGDVYIRR